MSYQVIARKWRPQTFEAMVGQDHITQTLLNALSSDRLHHGLIFTGPRGTGKTSSARILAKSLRCPNAVDYIPCNTCDTCQEISLSRHLDVIELDAASHNSVEDIRSLLEGVMNAPSFGKWKIYIIDEVHMLSTSAFNALLKTLEEPPAHVLFIFATTEIQKIPQTILSRCQRFDFKRITTRQISEHLMRICKEEKIEADEDALWLIARHGDGSMRDALSLLDQVITFSSSSLKKDNVAKLLGLTDRELMYATVASLTARDIEQAMSCLDRFAQSGYEAKVFATDLLETLRHLLIVKISGSRVSHLVDLPDSELKILSEMTKALTEEDLHFLFDMIFKGVQDLMRAHDPVLVLEILILRAVRAPQVHDLMSLLKNAPTVSEHGTSAKPAVTSLVGSAPVDTVKAEPALEGLNKQLPPADQWLQFVELVRARDAFFAAKIENLLFAGLEQKILRLAIPPKLTFLREQLNQVEIKEKFKSYIDSIWGQGYAFEVTFSKDSPARAESAQSLANKKKEAQDESIRAQALAHPKVQAAQKIFNGEVKAVTPLKQGGPK